MGNEENLSVKDCLAISEDGLRRIIVNEMLHVGFIPSLRGFEYFKELLVLVIKDGNVDNLMDDKYKRVADKFGVNVIVLERNVRTLVINTFAKSGGYKFLNDYFDLEVVEDRPPTNGQLLSLMGEYIAFYLFEQNIGGLADNIFVMEQNDAAALTVKE